MMSYAIKRDKYESLAINHVNDAYCNAIPPYIEGRVFNKFTVNYFKNDVCLMASSLLIENYFPTRARDR